MRAIFIFFAFIFFSCQHTEVVWVCTCEQQKDVRLFVENNIKSANNMSDEEMEDVIRELYKTGVKTICQKKQITYEVDNGSRVNIQGLDKCETISDVY